MLLLRRAVTPAVAHAASHAALTHALADAARSLTLLAPLSPLPLCPLSLSFSQLRPPLLHTGVPVQGNLRFPVGGFTG
jgi:hypothetical protein